MKSFKKELCQALIMNAISHPTPPSHSVTLPVAPALASSQLQGFQLITNFK